VLPNQFGDARLAAVRQHHLNGAHRVKVKICIASAPGSWKDLQFFTLHENCLITMATAPDATDAEMKAAMDVAFKGARRWLEEECESPHRLDDIRKARAAGAWPIKRPTA